MISNEHVIVQPVVSLLFFFSSYILHIKLTVNICLYRFSWHVMQSGVSQNHANFRTLSSFSSARVTTLSALLAKYCSIIQALVGIAHCSRGHAQIEGSAHARPLNDPQFIVALVVAQAILSYFVTKALLAKDCNHSEAYKDIHISKECIQDNRTDEFWNTLWVQIEVIAQAVGNSITKPRTASVQWDRANAGCNSDQAISDYYKVNINK